MNDKFLFDLNYSAYDGWNDFYLVMNAKKKNNNKTRWSSVTVGYNGFFILKIEHFIFGFFQYLMFNNAPKALTKYKFHYKVYF
jgi:hypothetical protein